MRTEVKILFNVGHIPGGASAVLVPSGIGSDAATVDEFTVQGKKHISVSVTLDDTDKRLPILFEWLAQLGVLSTEIREDRYTDDELDAARLVVAAPKPELEIFGGPRVGTSYDMSAACPQCGAGARQTSALIIEGEALAELEGRQAASTYYSDIIVGERLAEHLESIGVKGLSFRNVYAAMEDNRQIKLRWRQICAGKVLPPFSPHTTGIWRKKECDGCGRSGFFATHKLPSRIAYRAEDLAGAKDVNTTWEWFGDWDFDGDVSNAQFPYPWLLVTPKVMQVFRDAGVTEFDWLPIRVVNEG